MVQNRPTSDLPIGRKSATGSFGIGLPLSADRIFASLPPRVAVTGISRNGSHGQGSAGFMTDRRSAGVPTFLANYGSPLGYAFDGTTHVQRPAHWRAEMLENLSVRLEGQNPVPRAFRLRHHSKGFTATFRTLG